MANGLGALLARNKIQNQPTEVRAPEPSIESPVAANTSPVATGDTRISDQEKPVVAPVKTSPFGRKAASPGQPQAPAAASDSAGDEAQAGQSANAVGSIPRLAGIRFGGASSRPSEPVVGADSLDPRSLDSLEALSNIEAEGIAPKPTHSTFADETPATKPTRTLPPELEKQQLQFVDLLDGMYEIVHDPELLGNVVKSMMIELGANPQYEKLLAPSDVRLVVKAARDSMGLARVKKTEAKAKRSGAAGARAAKAVDSDMLADLAELGIGGLE